MKNYYATGNGGCGTAVYAFELKKKRDEFVAWNDSHDQRRSISRDDARRYGRTAIVLGGADAPEREVQI